MKLHGEEHENTLISALNYANSLVDLEQAPEAEEARSLLHKTIPVARRVLGEGHRLTLKMRWVYAQSLYEADHATLDDLREAVTTLEDTEQIARRVFGGAHPIAVEVERDLGKARVALRAREMSPGSA